MESRSLRASSAVSTGVFPRFTTYFGPRTELAGFILTTWPITSQSKSIRMAARCCHCRCAAGVVLNVPRDDGRRYLVQGLNPMLAAPHEELINRLSVSRSCIPVANIGGKEFEKSPRCVFAGARDRCRHFAEACAREIPRRGVCEVTGHD